MSGRICYIARMDRGDRVGAIRLVSTRGEEQWQPPAGPADSLAVMTETTGAASWIASRAARSGVALLIVDVGGGQCRWVTAIGDEPAVVAAALAQSEEWGEGGRVASSHWAAPSIAEACVQTLGPVRLSRPSRSSKELAARTGDDLAGRRVGALAIADVSARLLVDALDERGVTVERAISLWHALALAWDPAASTVLEGDTVVASSAPVTAVLLFDSGRLVWAWSRGGELLAGGTLRLPTRQGAAPQVASADVARLSTDWLSWSVQLGIAPARAIVLSPALESGPDSLSPAELGTQLGKVWPGATVDLVVHDDPLGATLARLAGVADDVPQEDEGGQGLVTLTRRPGRSHRAMYRWSALAMVVAAGAIGALGYKGWSGASSVRDRAAAARAETRAMVEQVVPPKDVIQQEMVNSRPRAFLEDQLNARRQLLNPSGGMEPAKPILAELDAVSYVLGNEDIRLLELNLSGSAVLISVQVPNTRTGEELIKSMESVHGSRIAQWEPDWGTGSGDAKRTILLKGRWAPDTSRRAGGQP